MKTAILVDSASDLDETFARKLDIYLIKFHAFLDDNEYVLNENITRDSYISLLKKSKDYPKTATPTKEEVVSLLDFLKEKGFSRFVFIVSSKKISRIYDLCESIIKEDSVLRKNSILFDSQSTSAELGIMTLLLKLKYPIDNLSFREILSILDNIKNNSKFYFTVFDLSYLVRGGRLKPIQGFVGKLFNIYPIGTQKDGLPVVINKVFGLNKLLDTTLSLINDFVYQKEFYYGLLTSSLESEVFAEKLNSLIRTKFKGKHHFVYHFKTNLIPSSHFGPEVFGVVVVRL